MFNKRIKILTTLSLSALLLFSPMTINANPSSENSEENNMKTENQVDLLSEKESKDYVERKLKEGIKFEQNLNLSESEIDERFKEISEKYKVNELLSDEDSEFVTFYSTVNATDLDSEDTSSDVTPRYAPINKATPFNFSRTKYGLNTRFKGSFNLKRLGAVNNFSYSIDSSATCNNSHLGSIKTKLSCEVYGLLGSGGLIKAYSGSISSNTRRSPGTLYYSASAPTGVIAGFVGAYLNPSATFVTKNGSSLQLP